MKKLIILLTFVACLGLPLVSHGFSGEYDPGFVLHITWHPDGSATAESVVRFSTELYDYHIRRGGRKFWVKYTWENGHRLERVDPIRKTNGREFVEKWNYPRFYYSGKNSFKIDEAYKLQGSIHAKLYIMERYIDPEESGVVGDSRASWSVKWDDHDSGPVHHDGIRWKTVNGRRMQMENCEDKIKKMQAEFRANKPVKPTITMVDFRTESKADTKDYIEHFTVGIRNEQRSEAKFGLVEIYLSGGKYGSQYPDYKFRDVVIPSGKTAKISFKLSEVYKNRHDRRRLVKKILVLVYLVSGDSKAFAGKSFDIQELRKRASITVE